MSLKNIPRNCVLGINKLDPIPDYPFFLSDLEVFANNIHAMRLLAAVPDRDELIDDVKSFFIAPVLIVSLGDPNWVFSRHEKYVVHIEKSRKLVIFLSDRENVEQTSFSWLTGRGQGSIAADEMPQTRANVTLISCNNNSGLAIPGKLFSL